MLDIQIGPALFLGVVLLNAVINLYTLRRMGSYPPPGFTPRVSILVPARNEEKTIEACVRSLLGQNYPDFEVVVLNDNSEDRTGEILAGLAAEDRRLRVIQGRPLPDGWLGKHWAAEQLVGAADGEVLLFTDADTLHSRQALHDGIAALLAEDADMLSGLPQELAETWAEKLMVPVMFWGVISFLPLWLAYRLRLPALSTAIGQHMLFRRPALEAIGGFEAVRDEVLDDLALAQRIKANGLRWRVVSARAQVQCRMYHNAREVVEGFGKNYAATFGGSLLIFLLIWTWLAFAFVEPLVVLLLALFGAPFPPEVIRLAGLAVVFALALWAISNRRFGFPLYLVPLYPLTILMAYGIGLYSIVARLTGRAQWKGRTVAQPAGK